MTWTSGTLSELATGYWPAATLIAAVELRVFEAIDQRPGNVQALAQRLELPADRLESLLDGLAAMRLVVKNEGHYGIEPSALPFLSRTSPTCLLDGLAYNADLYRQWANLPALIRGDAPAEGGRQLGGDAESTKRFVLAMEAKAKAFAPAIAGQIELSGVKTLLDVGSGPGTLSRLLLGRNVDLMATLLDLPPILDVAKAMTDGLPERRRLQFHPANYRLDDLPSADAILYAGALHQETATSAAALFGKVRRALPAGGRFYVIDLMLDDGRTSPAFSAMFQLNMLVLRPGARVFETGEVVRLLVAAGFDDVQILPASQTPYRIVVGR
jgi:hypothetical protein